ncbi:MAG: RNA methyltransferase [Candidatus Hermodarchaeota archaeon]
MNKKRISKDLDKFEETKIKEEYRNLSFTIILVQVEHAGNIGSIARLMKNFDFDDLIIFNPLENIENIKSHKTCGYAMHGRDILLNAKIITVDNKDNHIFELKNLLKNFDLVLATTAKGEKYSNIKRLSIFPEDLEIPISEKPLKIALLFGKESRGLTNDEIKLADIFLRIPASIKYPTLNLSHSCGIMLYEIYKKINALKLGRGKSPVLLADKEDRIILYKFLKEIIETLKIRNYKEDKVFQAFKNIYERALISKKELSLILGLFSKIEAILKDVKPYET